MFGIIPRSMWQRLIPPDENNMIDMKVNLFVLRAHGKTLLIDAGLGDTLSDRERKIYTTQGGSTLEEGLASLGLTTDRIDYVVLTHLHTDHAGGAVKLVDGVFVPRFENAKYVVSRQEYEDATNPNERTGAVYVPERYLALQKAGQLELIDSDTEILPCVKAVFTGGHTGGHFALEMESEGEKVFYYADIFCSSAHMGVPYVPATDLYPLQSMEIKRSKLPEIIDENVIMAFDHDIHMPFGRVWQEGKRLEVVPVEP